MKLLTRTSIYFLILFGVVLIIGGLSFTKGLRFIVYKQIDEGLKLEESIIEEEIRFNSDIPDYTHRFGHEIEVQLFKKYTKPIWFIKDTVLTNNDENIPLPYRYLCKKQNFKGKGYSIKIFHPLDDSHYLIRNIIIALIIMIGFIFISMLFFNILGSKRIWTPFYNTLNQLNHYDIKNKEKLELEESTIKEFNSLNHALIRMSEKIRNDFYNLKEFTENASHEIQTPLAIAKTKLEILIQSTNLNDKQIESVNAVNQAITKLSKLNAGLLLISKIENNQYENPQSVSINELINKTVADLNDFIEHKNLEVTIRENNNLNIIINHFLAEILINNLINNSIKHNIVDGFILITINESELIISNSGQLPEREFDPQELFQRFKKLSNNFESVGLGLAIVKKICDTNQLNISYSIIENRHTITVSKEN